MGLLGKHLESNHTNNEKELLRIKLRGWCCINRSQLSYGLTALALVRADGVQPSLHLDEYVHIRTVYIWPCGPLRKYN